MSFRALTHIGTVAVGLGLVLAGCGGDSSTTASSQPAASAPSPRTLTVFAAASLTLPFHDLKARFEADNPGVTVNVIFGVSSDLATQIVHSGSADVFAPAGDSAMKTVTSAGKADGTPVPFATNVLEIVTAPGNPKKIASFADLARPDVKVAVCAPAAACGMAALQVEHATGVTLKPTNEELSLKATLGRVTSGDDDAGLVYATDVVAAKTTVQGIMFPEASNAVTNYPIAVVKDAPQADLARKFLELVTGQFGQQTLKAAGFGTN